jgi:hypothetical protein
MWRRIAVVALLGYGAWQGWTSRPIERAPGELAPEEPEQVDAAESPSFDYKGFRITPLADFRIEARVLGTERYRLGREAKLSPIDLALGWGPMSDSAVLGRLDISQGNRFYRYHWDDQPPIPPQTIATSSANMHMIPARADIERRLGRLRPGSVVVVSGKLVLAETGDGWSWRSSLTRADSGAGACELVWVDEVMERAPDAGTGNR